MDGKGCWRDNVFMERFLPSIKYEEVYLRMACTLRHCRSRQRLNPVQRSTYPRRVLRLNKGGHLSNLYWT